MLVWTPKHPKAHPDMLGFIPDFLSEEDPRPAREQFDQNYAHGGGWKHFEGFKMLPNGNLKYPGDPPVALLLETKLRDEIIRFYDCSWVTITQPDGSFEVCRMD